jgi:membrane-associated protease RseP (regulator of RpoE activity)
VSTNGPPYLPPFRITESAPEAGLYSFAEHFYPRPRHRYWLHALLLVATLLSTTIVGAGMARSFAQNRPIDFGESLMGYLRMWHDPSYLLPGLPFSLTLLAILLAHEFGHFLTARYYLVDVSLPFFIPFPSLIGTMGAFIRIRSAILSKRVLFDIGIAGPLAGFVALVSPLVAGMALSKVVPGIGRSGELVFGTPLILRLMEWVRFPGVAVGDIYLHPVARAAWVGLLATALNLLPIGQLDGGHILYAFLGERTRYLSRVFIFILVLMGVFIAYSWLFWAALLFFFGMRHPAIVDPHPLGRFRTWLAVVALAILILSFTMAPVS